MTDEQNQLETDAESGQPRSKTKAILVMLAVVAGLSLLIALNMN